MSLERKFDKNLRGTWPWRFSAALRVDGGISPGCGLLLVLAGGASTGARRRVLASLGTSC